MSDLTAIIMLKEKIAVSKEFSPRERAFVLDAINIAVEVTAAQRRGLSDEQHAAGRTKAGNDIGGL